MKKLQLIRNILLVLTTIWSIFIIAAIILTYLDGYPLIWLDYFGTICLVIVPLFIADKSPIITTLFIELHESNNNQSQPEDEIDQDVVYLFDYSKVKNYLNRPIYFK
tara:strand:+ start:410 stop:730 length:321 start_codon:yes stop_codon:yes gene_type:complete